MPDIKYLQQPAHMSKERGQFVLVLHRAADERFDQFAWWRPAYHLQSCRMVRRSYLEPYQVNPRCSCTYPHLLRKNEVNKPGYWPGPLLDAMQDLLQDLWCRLETCRKEPSIFEGRGEGCAGCETVLMAFQTFCGGAHFPNLDPQ